MCVIRNAESIYSANRRKQSGRPGRGWMTLKGFERCETDSGYGPVADICEQAVKLTFLWK